MGSPNLKQLGKYQKRILRDMARKGYIISCLMNHFEYTECDICLQDKEGENVHGKIEGKILEAMGKRGLFIQTVFEPNIHQTIITFNLKEEVKKIFLD